MRKLAACLLGLGACAPYPARQSREPAPDVPLSTSEVRSQYAATLERIELRLSTNAIWPICENPPRGPNCGLIWKKLVAPEVLERFIAKACPGETKSSMSDACGALYVAAVKRKFLERYPHAIEADIIRHCEDVPADCGTIEATEHEYLKSHNGVLLRSHDADLQVARRRFEDEMDEARARQEDERLERQAQATRSALMESSALIAKSITKGSEQIANSAARRTPMNCTTSWLGNIASTSCY